MILAELLLLTLPIVAVDGDEAQFHLSLEERKTIDAAIDEAAEWLLRLQGGGSDASHIERQETSSVLLTSMIIWTLSEARSPRLDVPTGFRLCGILLEQRQEDGGIYRPGGGLELYESMAAERALDAFHRYHPEARMDTVLPPLRAAIASYLANTYEEAPPVHDAIGALQEDSSALSKAERDALRFLNRQGANQGGSEAPQRLTRRRPFLFEALSKDDPRASRAMVILRSQTTLGEPLGALIAEFGEATFLPPEPELQFSNLAVALTLARHGEPLLACADGSLLDWPRLLSKKTLETREGGSSWRSTGVSRRDDPVLVTCHAVNTLRLCRDARTPDRDR